MQNRRLHSPVFAYLTTIWSTHQGLYKSEASSSTEALTRRQLEPLHNTRENANALFALRISQNASSRKSKTLNSLSPTLLPSLPVLPCLRLRSPPLLLDLLQLSAPLIFNLRRRAAQAHKKLTALKLLSQPDSRPLARVFCTQPSDLCNIGFFKVVLLFVDWSHGWWERSCGGRGTGGV